METQQIEVKISASQLFRFLRNFIIGGIFLIVLFPILGDYGSLLYPIGREMFFRIIVEIMLIAYILLVIIDPTRSKPPQADTPPIVGTSEKVDKSYLPRFSYIFFGLTLFLIISIISTITSLQPKVSFWGDFYRGGGLFTQIHFLVFFVLLVSVLKKWQEWKKIVYTAIFVSLPVSLLAIIQYSFFSIYKFGSPSTLNNPVFLGAYLLLILPLTVVLAIYTPDKKWKKVLFLIAVMQFFGILFTFSRGAYLGMLSALFCFLLYRFFKLKRLKIRMAILAIIFLISLLFLTTLLLKNSAPFNEFADFYFNKLNGLVASEGRFVSWRAAILGIAEKPLFGWGIENFSIPFDKYYQYRAAPESYLPIGSWFDRSHNIFLDTGVERGIFGLLVFIFIWVFVFYKLIGAKNLSKETQAIKLGLILTFSAYLTQNLFNFDTITSSIYVFLWLGLTQFLVQPENFNSTETVPAVLEMKRKQKIGLWLTCIFFLPLFLFSLKNFHLDFFYANFKHNEAEKLYNFKKYSQTFPLYEDCLKKWTYLAHTCRHKYVSTLLSFAAENEILKPELSKEYFKKAFSLNEQNLKEERPYFTRALLLQGVIANYLIKLGEKDFKTHADYYFSKAIERSKNRPFGYLEWGKTDILFEDYESAKKKFLEALKISSDIQGPYSMLAVANLLEGNKKEADSFFTMADQKPPCEDDFIYLVEIYSKTKNSQELIKTYKRLIEINPKNLQYWVSLAVLQKEMNQLQEAKQTIGELLKLYPQLKNNNNIKGFLESVR